MKQLSVHGQNDAGLVCDGDEFCRHDKTFGPLPATECFKPYNPAVAQGNNRLVVDPKLIQLDRFAQVSLKLQTSDRPGMHRMVEYFISALTAGFGAIHGNFGIAQKIRSLRGRIIAEGDANAHREHNLVIVDLEGNGEPMLDALSDSNGVAGVMQLLDQDGEFITSRASESTLAKKELVAVFARP